MILKITGKDLKVFRMLKGFKTREEFAESSGKSLSTIHRYETLDNITKAARYFYDIELDWDVRGMKNL